eukprot:10532822-Alexandrium_andersonii.AAC.1
MSSNPKTSCTPSTSSQGPTSSTATSRNTARAAARDTGKGPKAAAHRRAFLRYTSQRPASALCTARPTSPA